MNTDEIAAALRLAFNDDSRRTSVGKLRELMPVIIELNDAGMKLSSIHLELDRLGVKMPYATFASSVSRLRKNMDVKSKKRDEISNQQVSQDIIAGLKSVATSKDNEKRFAIPRQAKSVK